MVKSEAIGAYRDPGWLAQAPGSYLPLVIIVRKA